MKKIFFTCGPSQLYPTISKHFVNALKEDILSLSHRSQSFQQIYHSTQTNLRKLLGIPKNYHIFFLCSSMEAMERIIQNCVIKKSLHFVNGSFSKKFYQMAELLKKKPIKFEVQLGEGFEIAKMRILKHIELICLTQNETSTGVSTPLDFKTISNWRKNGTLIAIDVVSSVPYVKIDFSNCDLAFFSVQKGFGLPAGLSVIIVSNLAIEKSELLRKKGLSSIGHHNFFSMLTKEKIYQTPETPNVLEIYLLGKVCQDMLKKGIITIRKETDKKAKLIYNFFDGHPRYKPFVKNPIYQSKTTITIDVNGETAKMIRKLRLNGVIVSSGYGGFKTEQIRIANFPAHSIQDIYNLIKLIGYN